MVQGIGNKGWWYGTNFFERGKSVVWSKIRVFDIVFFIDQSFCIRQPLLLFLFIQEYHQFSKSYLPEIDCVKVFKVFDQLPLPCKIGDKELDFEEGVQNTGVTLHKCGRWKARMGQFLGKRLTSNSDKSAS
ncbi:hypothetical protein LXL04_031491 [Taraxacum kok-saghyz]